MQFSKLHWYYFVTILGTKVHCCIMSKNAFISRTKLIEYWLYTVTISYAAVFNKLSKHIHNFKSPVEFYTMASFSFEVFYFKWFKLWWSMELYREDVQERVGGKYAYAKFWPVPRWMRMRSLGTQSYAWMYVCIYTSLFLICCMFVSWGKWCCWEKDKILNCHCWWLKWGSSTLIGNIR